ncbi:hypothetical protein NL676_013560 [Syzygium grande]|nr:hypothetical protein NL676_013560 [Syzygium grande]
MLEILEKLDLSGCDETTEDCLIKIQGVEIFFKDSTLSDPPGLPLLRYVPEILLDSSNYESKSDKTEGGEKATAWWMSKESCNQEMEQDKHCKIQINLGSDTYQDVDKALFEMEHPTPTKDCELLIAIKSDEQVKGILPLASKRGSIDLYVEGEVDSEPGNSECFEALENWRKTKDKRIGHYGSVDGGKMESMENREEKDGIGKLANRNDVVQSSCQRCEGVGHYERPCNATTEVEDKRDLPSVKRFRTIETDQEPAKRGRGRGPNVLQTQEEILQKEAEQGV